jgi:Putative zinc- or iron-chelating domain
MPPVSAKPPRAARRALPVVTRTRWSPALLAAVAEGERKALRPLLEQGSEGAVAAAAAAGERAAELIRAATAREPPPLPVACAPGCPSCCVSKIAVVAPEVLRIAAHLRQTLDPEALAALSERVRAVDGVTRNLTRAARARSGVPCPLLTEEGSCSVHPVRPLVCQGWTSLDASACERHFADPDGTPTAPAFTVAHELASAVLAGLGSAARDAGRDGALLELVAALRIALTHPDAAGRWEAGRPVFAPARDAETGPDPAR